MRRARHRPGRENQPGRGPGTCAVRRTPGTNDPHGRRLHRRARERARYARESSDQVAETRGRKTARAMRRPRLGCRANQRRSGMVRRPAAPDGTARPVNVEGMRAKPQERRPDRSVRRREGDGRPIDRAGDQGAPGRRATALESGAARRGMAPGERRDRRRTAQLDAPQGAEDAPTPSPPDRTARLKRSRSRASRYARTVRKAIFSATSRKTPGAQDPRLASRTVRP